MTTNLKNKAYQIIKERIMSCDYKPNTFLNEADLIEEIDASRTPIREALNKLEQEGFVQIIPKKGVMVTGLTLLEINQTFEARILLEPFIINNYMNRIDRNALIDIQKTSEQLIQTVPSAKTPEDSATLTINCTDCSTRPAPTNSLTICSIISMIRTNASACFPARISGSDILKRPGNISN